MFIYHALVANFFFNAVVFLRRLILFPSWTSDASTRLDQLTRNELERFSHLYCPFAHFWFQSWKHTHCSQQNVWLIKTSIEAAASSFLVIVIITIFAVEAQTACCASVLSTLLSRCSCISKCCHLNAESISRIQFLVSQQQPISKQLWLLRHSAIPFRHIKHLIVCCWKTRKFNLHKFGAAHKIPHHQPSNLWEPIMWMMSFCWSVWSLPEQKWIHERI